MVRLWMLARRGSTVCAVRDRLPERNLLMKDPMEYPTPVVADSGVNWNWWYYETEEEAETCAKAMRDFGWNEVHNCRGRVYSHGQVETGPLKGLWCVRFHQFNSPRVVGRDYEKEAKWQESLEQKGK